LPPQRVFILSPNPSQLQCLEMAAQQYTGQNPPPALYLVPVPGHSAPPPMVQAFVGGQQMLLVPICQQTAAPEAAIPNVLPCAPLQQPCSWTPDEQPPTAWYYDAHASAACAAGPCEQQQWTTTAFETAVEWMASGTRTPEVTPEPMGEEFRFMEVPYPTQWSEVKDSSFAEFTSGSLQKPATPIFLQDYVVDEAGGPQRRKSSERHPGCGAPHGV